MLHVHNTLKFFNLSDQFSDLNNQGDHEILICPAICLTEVRTNVDMELWTEYVKFTNARRSCQEIKSSMFQTKNSKIT